MARAPRLLTLSLIVNADDEFDAQGGSELDDALNRLIDAAQAALPAKHPLGVSMAWSTTLDPNSLNCGQCAECQAWVTDVEASDHLPGLIHGARVDGRLLCDDHLPAGHPHAS